MKRNYWPLFFIGIFSFVFSMIIWTISQAVKLPVVEDKSFMLKYQDVDDNYNNMMAANEEFLKKYNLTFELNDKLFPLTTEDIKYGQRVIEKYSAHKDLLKIGSNNLQITLIDKLTKEKKDAKINLVVTKTMTNEGEIVLTNNNFINEDNKFIAKIDINEETNWIITGSFKVDDTIGYIFIKTNAK